MFDEENFYAISDISESLRVCVLQPPSAWKIIIYGGDLGISAWRTRYNQETQLLIEEIESLDVKNRWTVKKVHRGVKNFSKAVCLSAALAKENLPESELPY